MHLVDCAVLCAAYLFGSVPCGLLVGHAAGLGDIRRLGSGNIGAANVLRSGYPALAAVTLALDLGKGAAAVGLAAALRTSMPVAAIAALVGAIAPVWLAFRGGKGVGAGFGALCLLYWPAALAGALAWVAGVALCRRSSVGSLAAAIAAPVTALSTQSSGGPWVTITAMSALVAARHADNVRRLLKGEEPRLGRSRSSD